MEWLQWRFFSRRADGVYREMVPTILPFCEAAVGKLAGSTSVGSLGGEVKNQQQRTTTALKPFYVSDGFGSAEEETVLRGAQDNTFTYGPSHETKLRCAAHFVFKKLRGSNKRSTKAEANWRRNGLVSLGGVTDGNVGATKKHRPRTGRGTQQT